ncbi:uncharacterized protein F4812DRAFT_56586 [Daldinia caldariorum]|uniref:uncharacterized protein n=1 Tax=Daldinia caldariorum TaxID=326644 RepID=UPI002007EF88|nr:uncharacterized protein F4812DRAFT_56586 [Daldinia caldariorum]KAI1467254.1 hypothetical protein F4812DRAFT_56586 [Daldinia caldariorum]
MKKRIIVCCDGTWQNADNGYVKPTASNPVPTLQIPSNVTRISRAFKRGCSNSTFQIVYYQSGVGSRAGVVDRILGGAFGIGIAENIREAYAYICANYVDGDEIILIGFSRGAFTARSIGGMISDLGLLTREGMEFFYPVFKDMQNWMNPNYKDQFPQIPFPNKPKGAHAADEYRDMLVKHGYTRVRQNKGTGDLIKVKAIGVWDTVGSLGIPQGKLRELFARLGIKSRSQEYRFYNTRLSNKIQHGFHALALDETRGPFSPTLWERQPEYRDTSDLRQVWFPGSHGNVGGGWADQGVSNITLAWMMDQLSSVGCEFVDDALERLYDRNVRYYHSLTPEKTKREKAASASCGCCGATREKGPQPWAAIPIFNPNKPVRPWSLHSIQAVKSPVYDLAGRVTRSPGMYKKMNPEHGRPTRAYLKDTNERIHSSVRVRLACEGLGLNDKDIWKCPALLRSWRPRRVAQSFPDPVPQDANWGPKANGNDGGEQSNDNNANDSSAATSKVIYDADESESATTQGGSSSQELRWVWEYVGPEEDAPYVRTLVEENIGPWERHLLELSIGKVHVYKYAEAQDVTRLRALNKRTHAKKFKEG